MKPSPKSTCVQDIGEERLHKFNRQLIELKPPKKKRVYKHESSEEEDTCSCQVEKQSYADICYGKIETEKPEFETVKSQASCSCEVCRDNFSKEFSYEVSTGNKCSHEKEEEEKPVCTTEKPCKKCKLSKRYEQQENEDEDRSFMFVSGESKEDLVRRKRGQHKKRTVRKSRQVGGVRSSTANNSDTKSTTDVSTLKNRRSIVQR